GLDKRYVTDVDLTARTTTGDPEGEVAERPEPPTREELERRLATLRGDIERPIPATSAVKIGGGRASRRALRGVAMERPVRQPENVSRGSAASTASIAVTVACWRSPAARGHP